MLFSRASCFPVVTLFLLKFHFLVGFQGTLSLRTFRRRGSKPYHIQLLSSDFLENDLVAIKLLQEEEEEGKSNKNNPRLCVVRPDGTVSPLCRHEDDLETDLFLDPTAGGPEKWEQVSEDENVVGRYGEGWYGQRPVPSLGGGPGYGAEADEIWSVDEELIQELEADNVDLPTLDVGIAHGEKARAGAY